MAINFFRADIPAGSVAKGASRAGHGLLCTLRCPACSAAQHAALPSMPRYPLCVPACAGKPMQRPRSFARPARRPPTHASATMRTGLFVPKVPSGSIPVLVRQTAPGPVPPGWAAVQAGRPFGAARPEATADPLLCLSPALPAAPAVPAVPAGGRVGRSGHALQHLFPLGGGEPAVSRGGLPI